MYLESRLSFLNYYEKFNIVTFIIWVRMDNRSTIIVFWQRLCTGQATFPLCPIPFQWKRERQKRKEAGFRLSGFSSRESEKSLALHSENSRAPDFLTCRIPGRKQRAAMSVYENSEPERDSNCSEYVLIIENVPSFMILRLTKYTRYCIILLGCFTHIHKLSDALQGIDDR